MMAVATQQGVSVYEESYKDFEQYPTNLVYRASYRKVLEGYKSRLDRASTRLFSKEGDPRVALDVRFRDYNHTILKFEETNPYQVQSLATLRSHLGDVSNGGAANFTRPDPKCRYISIYSDMNRLPLNVSRPMVNLLFSFHQVMPSYLDFISVFGTQLQQREVRYSGFHEQSTLRVEETKRPAVATLGRSGCYYQVCYNLKAVVDKGGKGKQKEWSIRQAALHHQFDAKNGNALWICTEGRGSGGLFDRIRDLTQDERRRQDWSYANNVECFRSSLATHLTCCHWSIEEWRPYMTWLEEIVDKETASAVSGVRTRVPGSNTNRKTYASEDLMLVQGYEEQANEIMTILEANNDVMKSLSRFYLNLLHNDGFSKQLKTECQEDIREFATQISDMIYGANMQILRARLLVKITADRKALVLQHLQSQATEAMADLTYMSYKEAIIMRIVTVVTLIYLPATFVSTFFSTDVVKYQGQDTNGSFSHVALWRWLQVTLPLSGLTLIIGYIWYRYQEAKSREKGMLLPA